MLLTLPHPRYAVHTEESVKTVTGNNSTDYVNEYLYFNRVGGLDTSIQVRRGALAKGVLQRYLSNGFAFLCLMRLAGIFPP